MPVLLRERSKGEKALMRGYDGEGIAAVLYADEVDPSAPGFWGSDATVEEVLHTIHSVGHVSLYPEALSLAPHSSRLTEALDVARGGHFLTVPRTHPEGAWFHYDDRTCEYDCMAIEYLTGPRSRTWGSSMTHGYRHPSPMSGPSRHRRCWSKRTGGFTRFSPMCGMAFR